MMSDNFKHILILLSAGLPLCSCSTEEPAESQSELRFEISGVSRSQITSAANITANPFAVFGDRIHADSADDPSVSKDIVYFNSPVQFYNSVWRTSKTEYWHNNHLHSFVAVHPASVLATETNFTYSDNKLSFSYTVPDNPAQTPDILVATHRRRYTDNREHDETGKPTGAGSVDAVYLRFSHILSQINIAPNYVDNLADKSASIEIIKLELSGFKTSARFDIKPAALLTSSQTDDREMAIPEQSTSGSGSFVKEFAKPIKIANDRTDVSLLVGDDVLVMVPQTFAGDSEARFTLTYRLSSDPATLKQAALPLKDLKWESGKSYTYRCTIDRLGLSFGETSIIDWDATSVGDLDAR